MCLSDILCQNTVLRFLKYSPLFLNFGLATLDFLFALLSTKLQIDFIIIQLI